MVDESRTWKEQYDLLMNMMIQDDTRYWQRFSVLALLNGGLVVAFATFLGYMPQSEHLGTLIGLFSISTVGFISSCLWFKITKISLKWRAFYHDKINVLESNMVKELWINPQNSEEDKSKGIGSATKTALYYPKTFLIFWVVLGVVAVLFTLLV